ncbi:hypothetical protein GLOTRDRAFT_114739 [Gloeophyllum trabeum ATCC 11539]|uniref:Uncharacterized protein n=1 Tax=Gloeophyllum trabeum (strain ATCC 11539 / FP-39264 / Madison 617) TaxID=670483 RepID=S7RY09_GLOTA|nr:uncharacterized protein GLOTRDRAFT_114739 [Gloeophyllum trabeum ATCC 11539]EPQ58279.1 hypothetical protein GLOTRDRAFT_114739 [Gloeophyllum trabeum ATCC 11539]
MPSLRRTISSPSIRAARSAPYPSIGSAGATRTHGHVPRRTSGSETASRRVLADIEWWRVLDGQREVDADSLEDENRDQTQDDAQEAAEAPMDVAPSDEMARLTIGSPSLSPLAVARGLPVDNSDVVPTSPVSDLPAVPLAIAPVTPPHGRRRNTLQSSSSSTESTPESFRSHSLVLPDVSFGPLASGQPDLIPLRLPMYPPAGLRPPPLSSVRSFSYNDLDCGRFSDEGLQSPTFPGTGGAAFADPLF